MTNKTAHVDPLNNLSSIDSQPIGKDTMSSALVDAKNYHAWTSTWIMPYIHGRILDIGGGTGNHLSNLETYNLVSLDISNQCTATLQKRYESYKNWHFICGDITDPNIINILGKESFDTVLSCNVFEHIKNDKNAFDHATQLLKPNGRLILVLPAHQQLFGNMDRLAGHFRRYNRKLAIQRLKDYGLIPEKLRYVNMFGGIGWFINNRFFRHNNLSSSSINSQIRLFDRFIIPIIRFFEGNRSMPFGQSLICVGRKPADK